LLKVRPAPTLCTIKQEGWPVRNVSSALAPEAQREVVEAQIEFLAAGLERPFAYGRGPLPGGEAETARFVAHPMQIQDLRGRQPLQLDENGAKLGHWPTRVRRFYDESHVEQRYYPECAELIQAALRADRVFVFDHNVRRNTGRKQQAAGHGVGQPVYHAHTDYTPRSALRRLQELMGPDAGRRLSRYVQVNLWRPIRGPVRDAPLALCDGASVSPDALRPVELRYADRTGEIYYLMHEPEQRWYFASDMAVDEAWLFKNFDSKSPGPGATAPHSAFTDSRHRTVSPRESIEVRALAIFH
jgi:hypothetical protein